MITCVGGELAPQMIQSLRGSLRHDVEVVGVDANAEAVGRHFCDFFYTVPRGDADTYTEVISDLAQRHEVDLILPTSDEEALALSANRSAIERGERKLACADGATLEMLANKAETYRRLGEAGIAMPHWKETMSIDELEVAVSEMADISEDLVVKPASARGGRGVCVISKNVHGIQRFSDRREIHMDMAGFKDEFLNGFKTQFPAIVMERLIDPVHDLDMLAWEGKPLRIVARKRIDSAVPNEGHTVVENDEFYQLGRKIVETLKLSWLYDCDIMCNSKGVPGILEINPRPSGSVAVSVAAGIPLLEDLISLAKGEEIPEVPIPFGKRIVPFKSLAVV